MGDDLVRIRDLLDGYGTKVGLGRSRDANVIWSRWTEIVGGAVAAHAEPSSLREGVLKVRTDSPAWAAELGYLVGEIRTRANALIGRQSVVEVRVWTSPGRIAVKPQGHSGSSPSAATAAATSAAEEAADRTPAKDPHEALERAREAWRRRGDNEDRDPR